MSNYRDESLAFCKLLDDFLYVVYCTSEDFFDTYGLFDWISPEDTSFYVHRKFGVPMPRVPDVIEGLSDAEYAKLVYDAANQLLVALEYYYDDDDEDWDRDLIEDYHVDLYKEYAEHIMNQMKEIMG